MSERLGIYSREKATAGFSVGLSESCPAGVGRAGGGGVLRKRRANAPHFPGPVAFRRLPIDLDAQFFGAPKDEIGLFSIRPVGVKRFSASAPLAGLTFLAGPRFSSG